MSFPGSSPIARVGGQIAAIQSVPAPTDQHLVVALPTDLAAGPQADVTVSLNGRVSIPLAFQVTPWISSVTPVRTSLAAPGARLVLGGAGFTSPAAVRFELATPPPPASPPASVLVTVTTFDPGGTDSQATVALPASLVNGTYNVRLVLAGNEASNTRPLEVIPLLTAPIGVAVVTAGLKQVHRLTLNGARLNGADVRVVIDGVAHQTGQNLNAATLVVTLGRQLAPGPHTVAVQVDGHASHDLELLI
jgi:hypothetical protein